MLEIAVECLFDGVRCLKREMMRGFRRMGWTVWICVVVAHLATVLGKRLKAWADLLFRYGFCGMDSG